ncbi:PAS-domain containing protein [Pannonibacter sp. Pt2-lr]
MTISSGTTEYIDMLQAALDHVNQGFSVFDANLQLVAWNRGLWEMLDFPQELARRGAHLAEFLRVNTERGEYGPGDVEGKIQRRLERARQFVPHYFERIRPNGQVIAVRGTPLPQGGFVTIYTDITEERQRQEKLERTVAERTRALRQSEDWLRFVTDNIPALVAYMAPDTGSGAGPVFRFANRRYAEWFGHSIASIAGARRGKYWGRSSSPSCSRRSSMRSAAMRCPTSTAAASRTVSLPTCAPPSFRT